MLEKNSLQYGSDVTVILARESQNGTWSAISERLLSRFRSSNQKFATRCELLVIFTKIRGTMVVSMFQFQCTTLPLI